MKKFLNKAFGKASNSHRNKTATTPPSSTRKVTFKVNKSGPTRTASMTAFKNKVSKNVAQNPPEHHQQLLPEEEEAEECLWYKGEESKRLKSETQKVVAWMKKSQSWQDDDVPFIRRQGDSTRGLESFMRENKERCRKLRQEGLAIVMSAQEIHSMQSMGGGFFGGDAASPFASDSKTMSNMARSYARACLPAAETARLMAKKDADYVDEHVRIEVTTPEYTRSLSFDFFQSLKDMNTVSEIDTASMISDDDTCSVATVSSTVSSTLKRRDSLACHQKRSSSSNLLRRHLTSTMATGALRVD